MSYSSFQIEVNYINNILYLYSIYCIIQSNIKVFYFQISSCYVYKYHIRMCRSFIVEENLEVEKKTPNPHK